MESPEPDARRRRHPAISVKARTKFLEAVAAGWSISHAAERAGVARQRFYERAKSDERFAVELREATEQGTHALEDEALRRGRDGVDEPVYQRGELVGTVRRYSDNLLMFLLKKRDPSYRENHRVEFGGSFGVDVDSPALVEALGRFAKQIDGYVNRRPDDVAPLALPPARDEAAP